MSVAAATLYLVAVMFPIPMRGNEPSQDVDNLVGVSSSRSP